MIRATNKGIPMSSQTNNLIPMSIGFNSKIRTIEAAACSCISAAFLARSLKELPHMVLCAVWRFPFPPDFCWNGFRTRKSGRFVAGSWAIRRFFGRLSTVMETTILCVVTVTTCSSRHDKKVFFTSFVVSILA